MQRGVWSPALLGPGTGEVPVPLAGRGGGAAGDVADFGYLAEQD